MSISESIRKMSLFRFDFGGKCQNIVGEGGEKIIKFESEITLRNNEDPTIRK